MTSSFKMSSDEAKYSLRSSFKVSSDEAKDRFTSSFILSSEEVREFCDPCTIGEGSEKTALFFCQECKEFLCGECREFHRKVSMTKKHNVLRIDGPNTASGQSGKDDELTKHFSNITVSGATVETPDDHTANAIKPFRKAKLARQINVSLDDDEKPCDLRGIVVVDNLMYVTDDANGKVKLFYTTGEAIAQYFDEGVNGLIAENKASSGITAIGKDRIAFTSRRIYFKILSKTGNTLNLEKTVGTNGYAVGICYYNDLIYVSVYGPDFSNRQAQIKIFTTDGALKRRIEPLFNGRHVKLQMADNLSISQRTGTIYVSDLNVGVIALNLTGKVQFIQQVFKTTNTATGISIDDQGQVYICGMNTKNVMTMSADGSDVNEILNKDCEFAKAVDIVGNQMYLCCINTDLVSVFQLTKLL